MPEFIVPSIACNTPIPEPLQVTQPPTANCKDGIKNGAETDVDCGGTCASKCSVGQACAIAADCLTGACSAGVCASANQPVG